LQLTFLGHYCGGGWFTGKRWSRYFQEHLEMLDEDSLRRLETNPLWILTLKIRPWQHIVAQCTGINAFLGDESLKSF